MTKHGGHFVFREFNLVRRSFLLEHLPVLGTYPTKEPASYRDPLIGAR